tara:strand:+ start:101 stop:919 length:819 start_codon:yes stop_codon:yes gene_type:complete
MAKVSGGAIRLIDKDGDPLDDGNGRLNINATLEAASVNVGDVDIRVGGSAASSGNGTVSIGTLRVTIAEDTTGVLSVDDNGSTLSIDDGGGTISVDGTVTANLSATDNAVLDTISLNTNVVGLSTFLEDSAHSSGDRGMHVLTVRKNVATSGGGADGDYVSLGTDYNGALYTRELSTYNLDTYTMLDIDNSAAQLSGLTATITAAHEIFLQADESNSGYVIVGDSDVADNRGMKLNPGDTIILNINDTRAIYLWGSADNQNVRCMIKHRSVT